MKIKPEHYQELKTAITRVVSEGFSEQICKTAKNDPRVKDLAKRIRWDLLWAALKLTPSAKETLDKIYEYGHDGHVDTALKKIVAEFELH